MTQLPLVIHSREADDDVIAILREEDGEGRLPRNPALLHGGRSWPMAGVELGLYVSLSGILTFKTSRICAASPGWCRRSACWSRPMRLISRRVPFRGKRNEPFLCG